MKVTTWRSDLPDREPDRFWPQSTQVVDADSGLVLCVYGGGGGSQQATFRRELVPLLTSAVNMWKQALSASTPPDAALGRLFGMIQQL